MSKNNNGSNEFYIEIVSEHDITRDEWLSVLSYFNIKLQEYKIGKYGDIKAILCDIGETK